MTTLRKQTTSFFMAIAGLYIENKKLLYFLIVCFGKKGNERFSSENNEICNGLITKRLKTKETA